MHLISYHYVYANTLLYNIVMRLFSELGSTDPWVG